MIIDEQLSPREEEPVDIALSPRSGGQTTTVTNRLRGLESDVASNHLENTTAYKENQQQ
jgi:hypothetical protein